METKHTPGPWDYLPGRSAIGFIDIVSRTEPVAQVTQSDNNPSPEDLANARLIAAAPRMFKVIEAGAKAGDAECIAIVETVNGNT